MTSRKVFDRNEAFESTRKYRNLPGMKHHCILVNYDLIREHERSQCF